MILDPGDDQRDGKRHEPQARLHTLQHRELVFRGRTGGCSGNIRGVARDRKVIRVPFSTSSFYFVRSRSSGLGVNASALHILPLFSFLGKTWKQRHL